MKRIPTLLLSVGLATVLSAERIDFGAGHSAQLILPEGWVATKVPEGLPTNPAKAAIVRYATKNGSNDAVLLSLLSVPDDQLADPAVLRELVEASTRQFADASVEHKAYLKEFKVAGKSGYAALFTDDGLVGLPPKKDDYKTLTACYVYLGNRILLVAMIFSDDPTAPAFTEARRLVQSLTLVSGQKPI